MPRKAFLPNLMLALIAAASLFTTAAIAAIVIYRVAAPAAAEPLPVYYDLPPFELTNQHGRPYGSADLAGKIYVADFIFTRCTLICPMLSMNMRAIQEAFEDEPGWERMRLVSFSVDTEHDTPERLRAYADRHGADPDHWFFLTGEQAEVWPLIEGGFKLQVARAPENPEMPFNHSGKLVLVDRQGRVRAYHDGTTAEGRQAMIADARRLLSTEE